MKHTKLIKAPHNQKSLYLRKDPKDKKKCSNKEL